MLTIRILPDVYSSLLLNFTFKPTKKLKNKHPNL